MKKNYCIILAAGLSSRMGAYKPLLMIDHRPAILYLIDHLHQAGVDGYIIVTGHNCNALMQTCCHVPNIIFVNNPDYAATGMFESAKIAFSHVPDDCSKLLFTLADIPLISSSIIHQVLEYEAPLVFPSYHFHRGHPVKISPDLLPDLIAYQGPGGLRGAFASLNTAPSFINTEESHILIDMDTPADYQKILAYVQTKRQEETI